MLIRTVLRVRRDRKALAAVLFALLLPLFVGFTALSIDSGVVCVAQAQLSTAADAAALAGARQLASDTRLTGNADMTSLITLANNQAVTLAGANHVLGLPVDVVGNASNSAGGDVLVGYLDPSNAYSSAMTTAAASSQLFNAVSVTTSRSAARTGVIPAFFSALMGNKGTALSLTSTALAWNYSITGFVSTNDLSAKMLPIVLDLNTYTAMMAGTTTDQYTWNPSTRTVTSGSDGVWESVLFPVTSGNTGNWGTIKVGVSNNRTSTLNRSSTESAQVSSPRFRGVPSSWTRPSAPPRSPSPGTLASARGSRARSRAPSATPSRSRSTTNPEATATTPGIGWSPSRPCGSWP